MKPPLPCASSVVPSGYTRVGEPASPLSQRSSDLSLAHSFPRSIREEIRCVVVGFVDGSCSLQDSALANTVLADDRRNGELELDPLAKPTADTLNLKPLQPPTSGSIVSSVRKPTERWRGNDERKDRNTEYIDLRRIQPIPARTGYARMATKDVKETTFEAFDVEPSTDCRESWAVIISWRSYR